MMRFLAACAAALLFGAATIPTQAQSGQETVVPTAPQANAAPMTDQEMREQYAKSMTYMLRRAKLVRTLTAQHMVYITENGDKPNLHLVEEASQVVAFDLVCDGNDFDPAALDQVATESTYRIAVEAGQSPIAATLREIGSTQPVQARMDLLGDISSSVFLFQVGRRRGLFDSLITDFGREKFCTGMRTNMRERYNSITAEKDTKQDETPEVK